MLKRVNDLMSRTFGNGLGNRGSIPSHLEYYKFIFLMIVSKEINY